jgi:hypothetical protein
VKPPVEAPDIEADQSVHVDAKLTQRRLEL